MANLFDGGGLKFDFHESPKFTNIIFPVLEKGKQDREDWLEIREKLTSTGEKIYNIIADSDI